MNQVFRVRDHFLNTIQYFEKYPHVRKYRLENYTHHDQIYVEKIEWHYKKELVNLLNETLSMGQSLNLFLRDQ